MASYPCLRKPGNWTRRDFKQPRARPQAARRLATEGPSFTVSGHEVRWQKWAFRIGFNPREGLVLNTVAYDGRPIFYRGRSPR